MNVARSELDTNADRLLLLETDWVLPPRTSEAVGFNGSDGRFFVTLRFPPSINVCLGRTDSAIVAAIFADAARYHFWPWLRKRKIALADYNHGPQDAARFLEQNPKALEILADAERLLVQHGTIRSRAEKTAGINAKVSDSALAVFAELIAALELRVKYLESVAPNNKPETERPVITTFSPPGQRVNLVNHESINPATVKKLFRI